MVVIRRVSLGSKEERLLLLGGTPQNILVGVHVYIKGEYLPPPPPYVTVCSTLVSEINLHIPLELKAKKDEH